MAYSKQTWVNAPDTSSPLSADRLNHMEDGIDSAHTELAGKADLVEGKLDPSQAPDITLTQFLGEAENQAAMLELSGELGDWCVRTDTATVFFIVGDDPSDLNDWRQMAYPPAPVSSVAGKTGAVTLAAADINSGTFNIARIPTGTSSSTVCIGNDARLSNERTPSDDSVTDAKVASNAAIALSKLATGHVSGFSDGSAANLEIDALSETEWGGVGSPESGRIYLVFED